MKLNKQNNMILFIIICIISFYHFLIHNGLEKIFMQTYLNYDFVKRPLKNCNNTLYKAVKCVGLPSGHAETVTVLSILLYYYKIIPLYICIILILVFSLQRVISHMHTFFQITLGILFGVFYSYIYISLNLSLLSFLVIAIIGLVLIMFTINKIDTEVYGPIPDWVDKNMLPSIYQKQNTSYIFKISNIFCNSFLQQRTFVNWDELEQYLDIIVERIKETKINFDCVVGIKTGGAIISDYISKKLNLPNYKIKVSRSENNCNKKPIHTINDIVQKQLLKNLDKFDICEEIDTDLTDKNIILIDELVSSGFTMKKTLDYLKYNKKANIIYPTSVGFSKGLFLNNFDFNYVIPYIVFIWPWGYDN